MLLLRCPFRRGGEIKPSPAHEISTLQRLAGFARSIDALDVTLHLRSAIPLATVPWLAVSTAPWGVLAASSVAIVSCLNCTSVIRFVRIRLR